MNNKSLYLIIGILTAVILALAVGMSIRESQWQTLKLIDDKKISVDHDALQACVDGWDATVSMSISKLDKATEDMSAARKANTEVNASREAQLKKMGE